ncbi:unnamed protein product [Thlaspi arvense]|uniref:Uncharacterized protein n=1 Tax=Thlaspi arvense TaxID=13288 RepID=A0AAU9SZ47_THLAR|nr:unnamed protein product [Thlaspi arvense]
MNNSNSPRIQLKMVKDDDLNCQQELIDPISSMVVIRELPISAKHDRIVFPPVNHENLQVSSSIYGFDRYLDSPSESESPSSSSRRSASSSSFSLFPSDSDGQPPQAACENDRESPSEAEEKTPPSLGGESPPSDSDGQSPLTACQFYRKSPLSPSEGGSKSRPSDSDGKSPRKSSYREVDIFHDWWQLLLVRVYSKLKNLVTWFSITLPSLSPVLAIAIWWWIRARRRRVNGETTDRLRDAIKERDERILQLLHQVAQMNELLVKHHKDIVSRR